MSLASYKTSLVLRRLFHVVPAGYLSEIYFCWIVIPETDGFVFAPPLIIKSFVFAPSTSKLETLTNELKHAQVAAERVFNLNDIKPEITDSKEVIEKYERTGQSWGFNQRIG